MRVLLLSLVLLSIVIQHCNCLPTLKETGIKDELTHLLQRLKKIDGVHHADKNKTGFVVYYPGMEVHYVKNAESRNAFARSDSRANRVDPCGGVPLRLTDPSGSITSPGGGWQYPNNAYCKWLIEAPGGQTVTVSVDQMQLEDSCWDYVEFYDGPTESSSVLGKLCKRTGQTITSYGSSMLVVFHSDHSINTGGFYLRWTFNVGGWNPAPVPPATQPPQPPPGGGGLMCGTQPIQPTGISSARIVGGMEARPNSWPWQCSVYGDQGGGYFNQCGGSVISNTYILTAAHCFFKEIQTPSGKQYQRTPDSQVIIACGIHDRNAGYLNTDPNAQRFTGVTVTVHESYSNDGNEFDIAVVRLPSPLTYNNIVQPICLPSAPVADGTNCVVTGWGKTQNAAESEQRLRQLEVPILNWDQCRGLHYVFQYVVTRNMLCAGHLSAGTDPCKGDSGGPLVCRQGGNWYQYGVVNFFMHVPYAADPSACANQNSPMIYASVYQFRSWIQQQTGVGSSRRSKSKDVKLPTTTPPFELVKDDKLNAAEKELLNLLRRKSHADKESKDMKPPTTTPAVELLKDDKLNAAEKELLNLLRRKSHADKA